ncbi:MAG: hypothetical protein LQ340_007168, partial [Diploschistes diacapsis]
MLSSAICLRCQFYAQSSARQNYRAFQRLCNRRLSVYPRFGSTRERDQFVSLLNDGDDSAGPTSFDVPPPTKASSSGSEASASYLEELFKSNRLHGSDSPLPQRSQYSPRPRYEEQEKIVQKLDRIRVAGGAASDLWDVCHELDARNPDIQKIEQYQLNLIKAFHHLVGERLLDQKQASKAPHLAEVLSLFNKWGVIKPKILFIEIRIYLKRLISMNFMQEPRFTEAESFVSSSLLHDLLEFWRLYFRSKIPEPNSSPKHPDFGQGKAEAWAALLSASSSGSTGKPNVTPFLVRFKRAFEIESMDEARDFGCAAAVTYLLLRHALEQKSLSETATFSARPFLWAFDRMISGSMPHFPYTRYSLDRGLRTDKVKQVLNTRWQQALRDLQSKRVEGRQNGAGGLDSKEQNQSDGNSQPPQLPFHSVFSPKLRKAVKEGDFTCVHREWLLFSRKSDTEQRKKKVNVVKRDYSDYLWAFVLLGRRGEVLQVWDHMKLKNIHAAVVHWNAFMELSRRTRNWAAVNSIWQQMQDSSITPDNQSWTTYLDALLREGKWREALQKMEVMGQSWKQEQSAISSSSLALPNADSTPTQPIDRTQYLPSIVPVNAVLSGLIRLKQHAPAKVMIAWARAHSLEPDIATYNILIRDAARTSNEASIRSLLAEMKTANISPDATTITTLFDGLVRGKFSDNFRSLPPAEQEATIARELDNMFAAGIPATGHTYGMLLHAVVMGASPNLPAARVVLSRLVASGQRIPPHVYTILFTHYFSLDPPDLAAIDALWRRIELERTPLDHVAWDRMVEGYAKLGLVDKMLEFLRRMPEVGKVPG